MCVYIEWYIIIVEVNLLGIKKYYILRNIGVRALTAKYLSASSILMKSLSIRDEDKINQRLGIPLLQTR